MKRVLGGLLAVVSFALLLTAPAQSAEIPPTPECVAAYEALIDRRAQESPRGPAPEHANGDAKRMAEALAAADCISDPKPIYMNIPAKPFTEQCYDAVAEAEALVGPKTAKLRPLTERFERRVTRPFLKRFWPLFNRFMKADLDKPRQIAKLGRRISKMSRVYQAKTLVFLTKTERIWAKDAYRILITYFELRSLLCVSNSPPFFGPRPGPKAGPGDRFVFRNRDVIFASFVYPVREWLKALRESLENLRGRDMHPSPSPFARVLLGPRSLGAAHFRAPD
jgi:hypothetical protein